MQKIVVLTALVLIFIIVFAILLTLQFRRDREKKKPLPPMGCTNEVVTISEIGVGSYTTNGRIGPNPVFQGDMNFSVKTEQAFDNGGVVILTEYPNLQENGVITGLSLRDIESGTENTVLAVPCTVGSTLSANSNSATCTSDLDRKGWQVTMVSVKSWKQAQNVNYLETLASPENNNYTVTWDPVESCDVYAVSLVLKGDSYDPVDQIVPTRLAFGGVVSGTTLKMKTAGSEYFTADIPEVESVQVVGFHHCDLNEITSTVCVGEFEGL